MWGATAGPAARGFPSPDFNPRAPCGARLYICMCVFPHLKFQSTRPVWGATHRQNQLGFNSLFQSTRPVWGATCPQNHSQVYSGISIHAPRVGRDVPDGHALELRDISIHAPRVGRDHRASQQDGLCGYFNPRAPCGARPKASLRRFISSLFQSTRPVWGATTPITCSISGYGDFNPRAPCGARQVTKGMAKADMVFQSTHPVWGATGVLSSGLG